MIACTYLKFLNCETHLRCGQKSGRRRLQCAPARVLHSRRTARRLSVSIVGCCHVALVHLRCRTCTERQRFVPATARCLWLEVRTFRSRALGTLGRYHRQCRALHALHARVYARNKFTDGHIMQGTASTSCQTRGQQRVSIPPTSSHHNEGNLGPIHLSYVNSRNHTQCCKPRAYIFLPAGSMALYIDCQNYDPRHHATQSSHVTA